MKIHTIRSSRREEAHFNSECGERSAKSSQSLVTSAATWLLGVLILLCAAATAKAQNYSIDWFKIAGGGGTSAGGSYSVSGAIGQADAGGPMSGGNFSLTGGFWALPGLVQTPGAPLLSISLNPQLSTLNLFWTPSTPGFTLQSTDRLAPTNWVNAPSGTNNPATVPAALPARFYRLSRP